MIAKPRSIDEYLASVPRDRRVLLEKLRRAIHAALPGAEECISYSMPAFRHQGHVVAGFLATGKGCSYYPFSGSTLDSMGDALAGYDRTKSALHFDAARPLPATLVRVLLSARVAELATRGSGPSAPKRPAKASAPKRPAKASAPKRPAKASAPKRRKKASASTRPAKAPARASRRGRGPDNRT